MMQHDMTNWPSSLVAANAVDQLAQQLEFARSTYHGQTARPWPDGVPFAQRQLYQEIALRFISQMGPTNRDSLDQGLVRAADNLARALRLVK